LCDSLHKELYLRSTYRDMVRKERILMFQRLKINETTLS